MNNFNHKKCSKNQSDYQKSENIMNKLNKLTQEQAQKIEYDMCDYFRMRLRNPGSPQEKELKAVVDKYMSDNYLDELEIPEAMKVEDIFTQSLASEMTSLMLKEAGTNAYNQAQPGYVEKTQTRDYCLNQFGKLANHMSVGLFEQAARDLFDKSFAMFPTWHEAYEPITEKTSLVQHVKQISPEYTRMALASPVKEELYRTLIEKISEGMDGSVRSWHTESMEKQFVNYYGARGKDQILKKIGNMAEANRTWEQNSGNNKHKMDK